MTVEIHLSGAAAPALAGPAEDLLRAAGDVGPKRRNVDYDEATLRGDAMAVAALILSIPGAISATMVLAERAGLLAGC